MAKSKARFKNRPRTNRRWSKKEDDLLMRSCEHYETKPISKKTAWNYIRTIMRNNYKHREYTVSSLSTHYADLKLNGKVTAYEDKVSESNQITEDDDEESDEEKSEKSSSTVVVPDDDDLKTIVGALANTPNSTVGNQILSVTRENSTNPMVHEDKSMIPNECSKKRKKYKKRKRNRRKKMKMKMLMKAISIIQAMDESLTDSSGSDLSESSAYSQIRKKRCSN